LPLIGGQDTSIPVNKSNAVDGGSDLTAVMLPITPDVDNSLVAVFVGAERGNSGNPIITSIAPEGLTLRLDNVNGPTGTANGSSSAAYADVLQTAAEEVSGNFDLSLLSGATYWGVMSVVLAPLTEGVVGSSAGSATVAGVGGFLIGAPGTSVGTSSVLGVGVVGIAGEGITAGQAAVTGIISSTSAGLAVGLAVVSGVGQSLSGVAGFTTGTSIVLGVGVVGIAGVGAVAGQATIAGVGESSIVPVGNIVGASTVLGVGESSIVPVGNIVGASTVLGVGGPGIDSFPKMTIEDALYQKLSADPGITILVGLGDDARIFPVILPPNIEFPAFHFSRVSADRSYSMDGKTGLVAALFQFESYSRKSPEEVKSLSEAIRQSLEGFRGEVGDVVINGIFLELDTNLNNFTEQTNLYRYTQDFMIHHQEN